MKLAAAGVARILIGDDFEGRGEVRDSYVVRGVADRVAVDPM